MSSGLDIEAAYVNAYNQMEAILPIWDLFVDHYLSKKRRTAELSKTARAEVFENLEEMNGYIQALTSNRSFYMEPVPDLLLKIQKQIDQMMEKTDEVELLSILYQMKQSLQEYLKTLPPYYQHLAEEAETDEERALQMEIQRILQKPAWFNEELRRKAFEEILRAGTQKRPLNPENVKVEFEEDKYKLEKAAYSLLQELKAQRSVKEEPKTELQKYLEKTTQELSEERWKENKERLSQATDAVTDAANKLLTLELKKLNLL
jgi:hypothetical protein